jgi:membrane protein implicated in regulation of membrane protease activity
MNFADSTLWWIAAGVLVALELGTNTFYLLMLSLGAVAGALAAHAGLPPAGQMVAGAVVALAAVLACRRWLRQRQDNLPARAQRSVNLDVGETVQIEQWNADGTAHLRYRGAPWTAVLRPDQTGTPHSGPHRVVELVGNRLVVEPI